MDEQFLSSGISLGSAEVAGRVWLSPMTGISDLPFRQVASALGATYVVTEMVACAQFANGRPDVVRRAAIGEGLPLMVVQLVGANPRWIAEGARLARRAGAQVIDLNFGCPAKDVTGVACGSALMRQPELAERLVRAAVEAQDAPVTVKMRLGWDEPTAPELAQRVQSAGARAVTVHGRTRVQFYSGAADWGAVADVKAAVTIPVVVNGDIIDVDTARRALATSGADAVMIGRAAVGRPWIAREIAAGLADEAYRPPEGESLAETVISHFEASLKFHGDRLGLRVFRKHLAGYISAAPWLATGEDTRTARARVCRLDEAAEVVCALRRLFAGPRARLAA